MRPQGRSEISPTHPRALAICDRCGFRYNHDQLKWQYDWRGPGLQNIRVLVCDSCTDKPQQNGQRTIILPADPIPIMNARPEFYVTDNNPLSAIGANPSPLLWQYGSRIGTMTKSAGVASAFDGNPNKPTFMSASIVTVDSSFDNYVGINWTGYPPTASSTINLPTITHTLSSYTIIAPNDGPFGSSAYVVQGSNLNAGWGTWTTISSGTTLQSIGEVISGTPVFGGRFQFHRVAFAGGIGPISVAQVSFSVSDGSSS